MDTIKTWHYIISPHSPPQGGDDGARSCAHPLPKSW